jgi:hypothetical protein
MGRCKAPRRRRCGTSSRSGNAADARPPPRPAGRPVLRLAIYYDGRHTIDKPENRPQNVKLFLRGPLEFLWWQKSILLFEIGYLRKNSGSRSGSAGEIGGGLEGRPRQSRILTMTSRGMMADKILKRPLQ